MPNMPFPADSPPGSPESMTSESSTSSFSEPSYSWMPSLLTSPDRDGFDQSHLKGARLQAFQPKALTFDTTISLSPAILEHQRARDPPLEVLDCILDNLRDLHLLDQAAYHHDLCCLALTSRSWSVAVAPRLHATIHFHLTTLHSERKWYGSKPKTRLKSIQKLLRTRAQHVRTIVVPDGHVLSAAPSRASADHADILASLVEQCPNLERLVGVSVPYGRDRTRLSEALASREHLLEHTWALDRTPTSKANSWKSKHAKGVALHCKWSRLTTLVIRGAPRATSSKEGLANLLSNTLASLPSLRHLSLSQLSAHDFDDTHLASIPRLLESLRLEHLPGVTEEGLSAFLTTGPPTALCSLSLLDVDIHGLAFIITLLTSLPTLVRLAIRTAHIDLDTASAPVLAHPTLTHLHWAVAPRETQQQKQQQQQQQQPLAANAILAAYITEDAFPALRRLHCPNDPAGLLQSVCRPLRPLRIDELPAGEDSDVALAAYARAAQALGTPGSCAAWVSAGDVATGGQGVVRFRVWDADVQRETRSFEVPRCLGRVEGVRVPRYVLSPWLRGVGEVVADAQTGLRGLF